MTSDSDFVLEFLGTGSSNGIPIPGCVCPVCLSLDPHNRRYRSSILLRSCQYNIVIDTGPEFRLQCLRSNLSSLSAVLFTHAHADHIAGFDDTRSFSMGSNSALPVYGSSETINSIRNRFSYIWQAKQLGGGLPIVDLHAVDCAFSVGNLTITPIPLKHGILDIFGYRVGNLAYLTDVSEIPLSSLPLLSNLDVLILSCIRLSPHPTHLNLSSALSIHEHLNPRFTYLTHISHELDHKMFSNLLAKNVFVAYDCLKLYFESFFSHARLDDC